MRLKRYTLTAHGDQGWHVGVPADDGPEVSEANV